LVYCIVSLFYYVFVLSPAPTWYIILLLWRDIAYLCWKCRYTPSKQTNKQIHIQVKYIFAIGQKFDSFLPLINSLFCSNRWNCCVGIFKNCFITGRMPRSGKQPVLNLLTGQKSGFSPHRGDSMHRFTSDLAEPTGTWVRLAVQNFTSIATGGGNAAPKYQQFPLFGKRVAP